MEPSLVGACETILNFGDFWDRDALYKKREEIADITGRYSSMQGQATRFISAAGTFMSDAERTAAGCTDYEKLDAFCNRFLRRELKGAEGKGREEIRLFSAVTPDGVTYFEDSITALADKIFVVEDDWGAASGAVMTRLRTMLKEQGADLIVGLSPFFPASRTEQIILPACKTAIIQNSRTLPINSVQPYRTFHARRFTDNDAISAHKERLSFDRRAIKEMLTCASDTMRAARELHNKLEGYYISAMDFKGIDRLFEELKCEIFIK